MEKKISSFRELDTQLRCEAVKRELMINELRMDVDRVLTILHAERWINENLHDIQLNLERELGHLCDASSDPRFSTHSEARVKGVGGYIPVFGGQISIIVAVQCKTFCNVD